jgi:malonate-semialdehyde dehydrogenase (acetylating) / methylmalonate-semialdehyde dehydrogenase
MLSFLRPQSILRASCCTSRRLTRRTLPPPLVVVGIIAARHPRAAAAMSTTTTTNSTNSRGLGLAPPPWINPETGLFRHWTDNAFVDFPSAEKKKKSEPEDTRSTSTSNSTSQQYYDVINPATQDVIGTVVDPTAEELSFVLGKAEIAYQQWQAVPLAQRQRVMLQLQHLLRQEDNNRLLAEWITVENGKTLADARGDVFRGLEVVETACHVAPHLLGDSLGNIARHMDCVSYRRPLGVTVGICPFNFPAMIPLWMFPLSLVCGNVMILKPSEKTPSASMLLAQLSAQAGLPPNVLQVIPGGIPTVQMLGGAPAVQAVSFVGSSAAGHAVADAVAGKRVQANLGAKNHAIVLPDTRSRRSVAVAQAIAGAAFGAAGQRCMALSVAILVGPPAVQDAMLHDIVQIARSYTVGAGHVPGVDVGPVISKASHQRILTILDQATTTTGTTEPSSSSSGQGQGGGQRAIVHLDGRNISVPDYPNGNFIGPTIVEVPSTENIAYTAEVFGPVLTIFRAASLDEAIALVNANPYGNGASLFTSSGSAARHFVQHIQCGQVGINVPIPVPLPAFSFTGNKGSLRGDLNFYGAAGVHFYTQLQTVTSHWSYDPVDQDTSGHDDTHTNATGAADLLGGVTMPTLGQK